MQLVSHPILCNYYVTYKCNAKCDFCDIWEKPSPYINLENAEDNFKALKKLGVKIIDFTGGEPLLHREIDQLLQLAKSYGFITTLTTNCLLYPKWAERLTGLVDMLHFSLDSFDEQTHNTMRGVDCYSFVIESIKIGIELGERPDIIFTVFNNNTSEIEKIYNNICMPNDLMLLLNPAFEYNDVNAQSLNDDTLDIINKWSKEKLIYLNNSFVQLIKDGGNQIDKPVCKAGSTTIVISPENKLVVPCYHLGLEEFQIDNNLNELYNSKKIKELTKMDGRHDKCQGCTINCYMQPSFATNLSKYWFKALPSTLKYNIKKGTWKKALA